VARASCRREADTFCELAADGSVLVDVTIVASPRVGIESAGSA
jgi:hypothetical protein